MTAAHCEGCGEFSVLLPLHGGKGGPLRCPLCVGKWNAEHGRRRRTGRIVIRAIKAFLDAGGKYDDIDKLKLSATIGDVLPELHLDPLGYMTDIARIDGADVDLTSELLADVLKLTHPDHHPPERKELAHRVTQGLLALQPFVFPALKPEKLEPRTSRNPRKASSSVDSRPAYPCSDCADTTPYFYCDACNAEYEKREQQEFERRTAKQRADYKRRRQRALTHRQARRCEACGTEFKRTRADARYCSDTCRQRAHRRVVVTDKKSNGGSTITNRDKLERKILALLNRHPAVFLNDILPEQRPRAQYQALSLAAGRLEAAGKIESWSYLTRFGKPGHKVLLRPGHEVKHPEKIPRLKSNEKLRCTNGGRAP
jgi:protein-arginine kinase activator protein McsA